MTNKLILSDKTNNVIITKIEMNIPNVYDIVFEYLNSEIAMISVKGDRVQFWKQDKDDIAKKYWEFSHNYENDNDMNLFYELIEVFKKDALEKLKRMH